MRAIGVLAAAVLAGSALGSAPMVVAADPARVEPARVEPAGVEPAGVEPAGVEPAGVEPAGVEPVVPAADRRWVPPVRPFVLVRAFAVGPRRWSPGHRGVDLAASLGQSILSPADGTVAFAGTVAQTPVVVVGHGDGLRSTFQPARAAVATGTVVRRGQQVAALTSGSGHCAPRLCLHWGVLRGREYVDPLVLLRSRRVVLLPLGEGEGG